MAVVGVERKVQPFVRGTVLWAIGRRTPCGGSYKAVQTFHPVSRVKSKGLSIGICVPLVTLNVATYGR
jgi:hypothetical protein